MKSGIFILKSIILIIAIIPFSVFASIRINEIMYDLEGTDTDREWIEIFNSSNEEIDLTGWKFNDGDNTTNHGLNEPPKNSGQGSLKIPSQGYAIFSADASKFLSEQTGYSGTVIDTVMSLNNTSALLKIIDVSGNEHFSFLYEKTMGANGDGNSLQYNETNWISASPTPGEKNFENTGPQQQIQNQATSQGGDAPYIPPEKMPKIKAYAGENKNVIIGAETEFRGQTSGIKNEPLENARFLWSFGDGSTKDGKNVTHIYRYPGEYVVVLNVISGEYSASDYLLIKAVPNQILISEVKTGKDGWIELQNNSSSEIDISNCQIKSGKEVFTFPNYTKIKSNTYLVIPHSISKIELLSGENFVELFYPGGFKADVFNYNGSLKEAESFNRENEASNISKETPGEKNSTTITKSRTNNKKSDEATKKESVQKKENGEETSQMANIIKVGEEDKEENTKIYLFAIISLIILSGGLIFFVYRKSRN